MMRALIVKFVAVDPVPPLGVVTNRPCRTGRRHGGMNTGVRIHGDVLATPPLNATAFVPGEVETGEKNRVPLDPLVGANDEITGAGKKLVALVPTPVVVVTVIGPIVALIGT